MINNTMRTGLFSLPTLIFMLSLCLTLSVGANPAPAPDAASEQASDDLMAEELSAAPAEQTTIEAESPAPWETEAAPATPEAAPSEVATEEIVAPAEEPAAVAAPSSESEAAPVAETAAAEAETEVVEVHSGPIDSSGSENWRMNVITDPAISARCDELDRDRSSKIEVKQRLMALIKRGEKAKKITPKEKISIERKLTDTGAKLKNELELTRMKIEAIEEHIIRQGCPGIRL